MSKHWKRFAAVVVSLTMAFQFCVNDFYAYAETTTPETAEQTPADQPQTPAEPTESAEPAPEAETDTTDPAQTPAEDMASGQESQDSDPAQGQTPVNEGEQPQEQEEAASTLKLEFKDEAGTTLKMVDPIALTGKTVGQPISLTEVGVDTNIEGYTLVDIKDKNDGTKDYNANSVEFTLTKNVTELQLVYRANPKEGETQPAEGNNTNTTEDSQQGEEDSEDDSEEFGINKNRAQINKNGISLLLNDADYTLYIGDSETLICEDDHWRHKWKSDDEGVVTVTTNSSWGFQSGTQTITAVGEGHTTISCGNYEVTVHVISPTLESISIVGKDSVDIGDKTTLTANPNPKNASLNGIKWSVDKEEIAEIDSNGVLTGKSEGTVTVTATVGEIKATKKVKVNNPVKSIDLSVNNIKLIVGNTQEISAKVEKADGSIVENPNISWSVEDPEIAKIDNGVVTALSEGTTKIVATYEGVTAECTVEVEKATYRLVYNSNYPDDAKKFQYTNGSGALTLVDAKENGENTNAVYEYDLNSEATIIEGMTCANYDFLGWSSDPEASEPDPIYSSGNKIVMSSNLTLYAVWGNRKNIQTGELNVTYRYRGKEDVDKEIEGAIINQRDHTVTFVLANNQDTFATDNTSFYGWEIDGRTYMFNETVTVRYYGDETKRVYVDAAFNNENVYAQFFVLKRNPDEKVGANSGNYYSVGTGIVDSSLLSLLYQDKMKYPNGADNTNNDVSQYIVQGPDAKQIADILNISLSETENIRWYVIKRQGDGFHVDGVIYDINKYFNVYFHDGDSIVKTITVGDADSVSPEEYPNISSDDFEGWELADGTPVDDGINTISSDIHVYAKYKDKYYVTGEFDDPTTGTVTNANQQVISGNQSQEMVFTAKDGYKITKLDVYRNGIFWYDRYVGQKSTTFEKTYADGNIEVIAYTEVDAGQTKDLKATVDYKLGDDVQADDHIDLTATVQVLQPDTLSTESVEAKTYTGWKLDSITINGEEVEELPATVNNGDAIVYNYVINEDDTKDLKATVDYKLGDDVQADDHIDLTATVQVLQPDTLSTESVEAKTYTGWKLDSITINGEEVEELPATVNNGDAIVYNYVINEDDTKDLTATVDYKLGDDVQADDHIDLTATVQVLQPDTLSTESVEAKTYTGWKLDSITINGEEVEELPATVNNGDAIVYNYVINEDDTKDLSYTVNHIVDGDLRERDVVTESVWVNSNQTTLNVQSVNYRTYEGYVLDTVLTGTIPTTIENGGVINVYYSADVHSTDPNTPDQGDGTPDKYQVRVDYSVTNGIFTFDYVYVTLVDENGRWSETGAGTLSENQIPGATANTGYDQNSFAWVGDVPTDGTVITVDTTFRANFDATPITPVTPPTDDDDDDTPTTPTTPGGGEGTGTTPTTGGPVAAADDDADAEDEPEEEEVEDEETPLSDGEEEVDEGETPLAKIDVWALINLIAAIITVLFGLILLLSKRHKNDDEEDEEERQARIERGEEKEQEQKRGWICKVLGVLVAIGSVVLFILTEDMSLPMAMTDEWTIWMVIIAVVELVLLLVGRHWKDVDDDEEEQAQA